MAKIFHASLHGLSKAKDLVLLDSDIDKTEWSDIDIEASEFYLLIPQNSDLRREYDQFWKITDIMQTNVLGFQTHRDHFAIDFDRDKLLDRMQEMFDRDTSDRDYSEKYLLKDNRDWNLSEARKQLTTDKEWKSKLIDCSYRPFDKRHCYFSPVSMDYPRRELINHVAGKDNLVLNLPRTVKLEEWRHSIISDVPCTAVSMDVNGSYVFPLYLYPTTQGEIEMGITRKPNISSKLLAKLEQTHGYTPTPEVILYYIYAIFNSPNYRSRYVEFLKGDFPRVPMTRNVDLFHQLGELGEQLVNLHLMKSPILDQISSSFINNGGGCIVDAGHPKYESGKVVINKQKDGFMDVPEAVWNFHVGGYQVCHKWLKDRKGRTLSQDDIEHYQKIVVALGQSIDLMAKIDAAIPNWPLDTAYN